MGTQEVVDYVMNSPHNTNRAVLESMLDSISDEGGANSVQETLIFDDIIEDYNDLYINREKFIAEPISSSDYNFGGKTFVTIVMYTDINGNSQSFKHICMLNGTVNSSMAGNVADYITDNMPYNKPTFLMVDNSTHNNTMGAINFDVPYMADTNKSVHISIYRID